MLKYRSRQGVTLRLAPSVCRAASLGGALLLGLAAISAPVLAAPVRAAPACVAPASVVTADEKLPSIAVGLRPGGNFRILALGSGSLAATGADGNPQPSFPAEMLASLRQSVPDAHIALTQLGLRRAKASDMLATLRTEMERGQYGLVIWQTGTVEAMDHTREESFVAAINEGAEIVRRAGADLVVIDPAFSRALHSRANPGPYSQALATLAAGPGIVLFRRYELTMGWVQRQELDLERANPQARAAVAANLAQCLGNALAQLVLSAAQK